MSTRKELLEKYTKEEIAEALFLVIELVREYEGELPSSFGYDIAVQSVATILLDFERCSE